MSSKKMFKFRKWICLSVLCIVTFLYVQLIHRSHWYQLEIRPRRYDETPTNKLNSSFCLDFLHGTNISQHMKQHNHNTTNIVSMSDVYFTNKNNCISFIEMRRTFYDHDLITEEEGSFPLAFIILLHQNVEQTVRLLEAIHRPQNVYCLHVDASAPTIIHKAIGVVASCYSNVFVVSAKVDIVYGHMSRLQAELKCMADLLKQHQNWKYVFNLPSQEYPLKTNAEIIRILKTYNNTNLIEGIANPKRQLQDRYSFRYSVVNGKMVKGNTKTPFRFKNQSITIYKGSALGAFSRSFVQFVFSSDVSRSLLEWMKDIHSPDEYFWATLNFNPSILAPGRFEGKRYTSRFIMVKMITIMKTNQIIS